MEFGDVKDKFEGFLKCTCILFRPYLKLKYHPPKNPGWEDHLQRFFVWVSTWLTVAVVYVGFVYLYIYRGPDGQEGHLLDFYEKGPKEILKGVMESASVAPMFNVTFFVVLYYAIISFAEKDFLKGRVLHVDISGLIKSVTLGKFDLSSNIAEQDESQINIARRNIFDTVQEPSKELISIVTASGWDLFGKGPALASPKQTTSTHQTQRRPGWFQQMISWIISFRFAQWMLGRFLKSNGRTLENGYLLPVIKERFRTVQIVLLDPDGPGVEKRAQEYLSGAGHKPIRDVEEYREAIRACILNIADAKKMNPNIELKLVPDVPKWKLILVEGEVWVQPILQSIRSDHSPLYAFRKSEYSLYHTFFNINEDIWHDKSGKKYVF